MKRLFHSLRRFARKDRGSMASIEFILLIPLMMTLLMTSIEMGILQYRQFFLDRGLDMTVRLVRLNTAANFTHEELKDQICAFSGLPSCADRLKLEMTPVPIRNFVGFAEDADCTDAAQPVQPNRTFVHGAQHELMILRACYKFDPVFPGAGLGFEMAQDADDGGQVKMVALTAFVQEP